jgi:hypothetical protein
MQNIRRSELPEQQPQALSYVGASNSMLPLAP